MPAGLVSGISTSFEELSQSLGQVAHVLLTRSPLIQGASSLSPFDLHVLSTPPAFVLSQDQTLHEGLFGHGRQSCVLVLPKESVCRNGSKAMPQNGVIGIDM